MWPVHITEAGGGEDFELFMNHLKAFMQKEWYAIIEKDLLSVLSAYSRKITEIVENRLLLEEKLFYSYMESKPTDFSFVSKQVAADVLSFLDKELDWSVIELEAKNKIAETRKKISRQVKNDLETEIPVLGMLERKANTESIDLATRNLNSLLRVVDNIVGQIQRKVNNVINRLTVSSENSLSAINGTLKELEAKLYNELANSSKLIEERETIISERKMLNEELSETNRRKKKYSAIAIRFTLLSCILCLLLIPEDYYWIPICMFAMALILPTIYWLFQDNEFLSLDVKIDPMVRREMALYEKLRIPEFSLQSVRPSTRAQLKSADNYFIKHGTDYGRMVGLTTLNAARSGGIGIGLGVGVALAAVRYLKLPTAKSVANELIRNSNKTLDSTENYLVDVFRDTKSTLQLMLNEYTDSIYNRYKEVLNSAFQQNKTLLASLDLTVKELSDLSARLQKFQTIHN